MNRQLTDILEMVLELEHLQSPDAAYSPAASPDQLLARAHASLKNTLCRARLDHKSQQTLQLFFEQSGRACFHMLLDEPIDWHNSPDKATLAESLFTTSRISRCNNAFSTQYAAVHHDLLQITPQAFFAQDPQAGRIAWRRLLDEGVLEHRSEIKRSDGTSFWVQGSYVALQDPNGRLVGQCGIQNDVTEEMVVLETLRHSEARLDEAQRIAHIGHWDWDIGTNDLKWSREIYRFVGLPYSESPANYADFVEATHPDDREAVATAVQNAVEGAPYSIEHRLVRPDGQVRWIHEQGVVHYDTSGLPTRMLGTAQDITDRRHTESELRAALELTEGVIHASPIGIGIFDAAGDCVHVNQAVSDLVGGTREQMAQLNWRTMESWQRSGLYEDAVQVLATGKIHRRQFELTTTFGREVAFSCIFVPLHAHHQPRFMIMLEDISSDIAAARDIERSLKEKEVLLQEIHHRVKNNLQVINGLLHLQMTKLGDSNQREVFHETIDRVQVMAVLHEKLYESDDFASIALPDYLNSLVESLSHSYAINRGGVQVIQKVDHLHLHMDQAIPLGLMLSEIISNAFKHAFHGTPDPTVHITGSPSIDGRYLLLISDNGTGLPAEVDIEASKTLGLKLIRNLAKQLGAQLTVHQDRGTQFALLLPSDTAS